MRQVVAKRIRRDLYDTLRQADMLHGSSYQIKEVRRSDANGGGRAGMIVCTGFRKHYQEAKRAYKEARKA